MPRYHLLPVLALAFAALAVPAAAQTPPMSDADYLAKVTTAAPAGLVKGATILQMQADGSMKTLQTGSNGFTCMLAPPAGDPMCADANAMAWVKALMTKTAPPNLVGFVYMLAGDNGASNTDPYASAKTADNNWIVTGSHVMIVGPAVKSMGYPMGPAADATRPYVMWADTPYVHLMIPVGATPTTTAAPQ